MDTESESETICSEKEKGDGERTSTKENPLWDYYKKIDNKSVKCNECKLDLKCQFGNTSTLRRHLERKHNVKYRKFLKEEVDFKLRTKKQIVKKPSSTSSSIVPFLQSSEKYGPSHPKNVALRNEISKWIAGSLLPFTIVDEQGFKNVLSVADEKLDIPHSTTFSRKLIPELYDKCVKQLKNELELEIPSLHSISVTTDMWTSKSMQSYLSITAHYVSKELKLLSRCLSCVNVVESHTGVTIAQELERNLSGWGLSINEPTIPIYCITDNASNMKTAVACTRMTHLFCFAHTLNLVISDMKKEYAGFDGLCKKCRAIVGHFRHSSTAKASLQARLKQLGLKPLELIQDVETRWNSEYLMMERLLYLKDGLAIELSDSNCKVDNLSSTEWGMVLAYVEILKPMYDATVTISSENKPTRSMIIPILYGITSHINGIIDKKAPGITLAKSIFKALKSRFPSYLETQPDVMCMVLDPRFKNHILPEHQKTLLNGNILKEIVEINKQPDTPHEISPDKSQPGTSRDEPKPMSSLFQAFQQSSKNENRPTDANKIKQQGELQLQNYLSEPRINISDDPFTWWQDNRSQYSALVGLARKYLGISATEVASERVFSTAGNVITSRRTRLLPENAEKLVFLHQNLKNFKL